MKGLALAAGDLVIGDGGFATVSGTAKIRQDLALALAEPYGGDQYHPEWGSVLQSYIGQPLDGELELLVRAEVVRVLQQYVDGQAADVATDSLSGSRSRYSYADLVDRIVSVNTTPSYDSLKVAVVLQTRAGSTVRIVRTVNL